MRNPYQRCLPGGLRRDGPAATAANRGKRCQCGKGIDWGLGNGHGTACKKGEYRNAVVRLRPQVLLPAMSSRPLSEGADESGVSSSPFVVRIRVPPYSGTSASHVFASPFGRCRRKWHIIVTFCSSHPSVPVLRCFCRRNVCAAAAAMSEIFGRNENCF